MSMLFLATDSLNGVNSSDLMSGGLLALVLGMFIVFFVLALVYYVYMGFAFMAIAKKAKQSTPGLSWIPGVGPTIIAFRSANMHWWPWLLLIGFFVPFVSTLFALAFGVFSIIWRWKLFEEVNKPGWWSILCIIPIVDMVMIGIAAWSKD